MPTMPIDKEEGCAVSRLKQDSNEEGKVQSSRPVTEDKECKYNKLSDV